MREGNLLFILQLPVREETEAPTSSDGKSECHVTAGTEPFCYEAGMLPEVMRGGLFIAATARRESWPDVAVERCPPDALGRALVISTGGMPWGAGGRCRIFFPGNVSPFRVREIPMFSWVFSPSPASHAPSNLHFWQKCRLLSEWQLRTFRWESWALETSRGGRGLIRTANRGEQAKRISMD